jgi:threonine dehydratase
MIRTVDAQLGRVGGVGFHTTPFARSDELSDALGFTTDGGVWVKDETGQVAGSHKARHLVTILLHVLSAELLGVPNWRVSDRPPLAIASCGNAAFAAGVLAKAVGWPLRVFVPPHADPVVLSALRDLHAEIVECPRRDSDPPGDPCMHRFREAVAAGAIPFTVQGTENAWCLDGGRTIGWEIARQFEETEVGPPLDRLFAQVGAGTFAACMAAGVRMGGVTPKLQAVQTQSCAPLQRAWDKASQLGGPAAAASHWSELMWPWEHVGNSAADGILDDETYDWIPVMGAMDGGGSPIVVTESQVDEANKVARKMTGIGASHTGTAGLAGLMAMIEEIDPSERVAVVFTGVSRSPS